jgi:hypothetical protein
VLLYDGQTNTTNVSVMETVENSASAVVSWMLREGRFNTRMREFGRELCQRIVAAGIPIVRSFCYVGTLHPQIAASAYIWKRGESLSTRIPGEYGLETRADFAQSPLMAARQTRQVVRRRLDDPASFNVSVVAEFRGESGTDYVALPMVWVRRFNEVQLGQSAALYCRVLTSDQTCARNNQISEPSPKKRIIKLDAPSVRRSLL